MTMKIQNLFILFFIIILFLFFGLFSVSAQEYDTALLHFETGPYSINYSQTAYFTVFYPVPESFRVGYLVPKAGTLKNMYLDAGRNTLDDSSVFTLMINDVAKTLAITIASGELTGHDTIHTEEVSTGDRISVRVVGSGTAGDIVFIRVVIEIEFDEHTIELITNTSTDAEFYIEKVISYDDIIIILLLLLLLIFGIVKFLVNFIIPKIVRFR